MLFREIAAFDVVHAQLSWPWIAFAPSGRALAFASSSSTIATRQLVGEAVAAGPSFTLPSDLRMDPGALGAFALSSASDGAPALLALSGGTGEAAVVAIVDPSGERRRARIDGLLGVGHDVRAIAFDRAGRRLWLSAESATETVTALLDVDSLTTVGVVRTLPFPRPAMHELHLHPQDDAVLLLAACGPDGTFARVVGFAGDAVSVIPTALDSGGVPAGFVGFSADAARVHLAEADELRTHGWPTLDELSSVPLADEFLSSFSGAVLGSDILVDGEDEPTGDDVVMLFDRSAIRGVVLTEPAPTGMWAGRLGTEAIVTVESKGDPVRGRVVLRTAQRPSGATKALLS